MKEMEEIEDHYNKNSNTANNETSQWNPVVFINSKYYFS